MLFICEQWCSLLLLFLPFSTRSTFLVLEFSVYEVWFSVGCPKETYNKLTRPYRLVKDQSGNSCFCRPFLWKDKKKRKRKHCSKYTIDKKNIYILLDWTSFEILNPNSSRRQLRHSSKITKTWRKIILLFSSGELCFTRIFWFSFFLFSPPSMKWILLL